MEDEDVLKEINQVDKVVPMVDKVVANMGFIWKKSVEKFAEDDTCFVCKGKLGKEYQVISVPSEKLDKGLSAFASVCNKCGLIEPGTDN